MKQKHDKLVQQFDDALREIWDEYLELNNELDKLRGKNLTEEEFKRAADLVLLIQDKFREEFFPFSHLIVSRYQFCVNASTSFQTFLSDLKKMGATEVVN